MHIFITGEIQIGKSTLLGRALSAFPNIRTSGYRTVTVEDVPDAKGSVYIIPADVPDAPLGEHNRAGIRYRLGHGRKVFTQVFDNYGVDCLSRTAGSDIIIMDEIGIMEREADAFSAKIIELLDGDTPIVGVLRKSAETPLAQTIRSHPNVKIVEVTEQNRDSLVEMLTKHIQYELTKNIDSAGTFTFRETSGGTEVLMIRTRGGKWSFPKGHIEKGETPQQAALRETLEETGICAEIISGFSVCVPSAREGEKRSVTYFLARECGGELRVQEGETDCVLWQNADTAAERICFEQDKSAYFAALEKWNDVNR
ncbi:MAG: NUDIX domain-containing protein [Oscillospiraceae bacterium]|nr:NUDIX domain-containing protein [Oscillospiraceae bacterium]